MKTLALVVAVGAAAVGLAACEEYPAPPPPAAVAAAPAAPAYAVPTAAYAPGAGCFYARDIKNHTVADGHTTYLNVNNRAVYRVETSNACFAAATSSDPIITREPPGTYYVCKPLDLDLSVSAGGIPSRCIVSSITPLSPAEIAALPPRLRP